MMMIDRMQVCALEAMARMRHTNWRFTVHYVTLPKYYGITPPPVSTAMGDRLQAGIPPRYVTNQLGQLTVASLWGRLIEYQLRLG